MQPDRGAAAHTIVAALLLLLMGGARAQSNGSDLGFDYLLLARMWPATFCESTKCDQPTYNLFTIHGLWPNSASGDDPVDCDKSDAFSRDLLTPEQLGRMSCEWKSFKGSNNGFWSHEWSKHGTCAKPLFQNESGYFGAALALSEQYDLNEALASNGLNPLAATAATQAQVQGILEKEWGVTPILTCYKGALQEVRMCFGTDLKPIDCPGGGGSCSSKGALDLPYGGEMPPVCASYFDGVPSASNVAAPATGGGAGGAVSERGCTKGTGLTADPRK